MLGGESGRRALPLRDAAERIHSRATGRRRGAGDRLPRAFQTGVDRVAPADEDEEIACGFVLLSGGPASHYQFSRACYELWAGSLGSGCGGEVAASKGLEHRWALRAGCG